MTDKQLKILNRQTERRSGGSTWFTELLMWVLLALYDWYWRSGPFATIPLPLTMNSNRKGLWMPDEILALPRLSPCERMVLCQVCYRAAINDGACEDTNAQIAAAIHVHEITVSKALKTLTGSLLLLPTNGAVRGYEPRVKLVALYSRQRESEPVRDNDTVTVTNHQKRTREQKKYQKSRHVRCQACPSTDRLVSHHLVPVCNGGTMAHGMITLCVACHKAVHTIDGHLNWKRVNPELTSHYFNLISA